MIIAVAFCGTVRAEPGSSLSNCQKTLDAGAARYVLKANKADDKHATKLAEMLEKARRKATVPDSGSNSLDNVLTRLIDRRSPEDARFAFVDNVVKLVTKIDVDDEGYFECLDKKTVTLTFDANLHKYQSVLNLIEEDVRERLDIVSLGKNDGLVVIAFNSNQIVHYVGIERHGSFTGNILFGPLLPGEYFRVVRAKAGRYTWDQIRQDSWYPPRIYSFGDNDNSFVVEAGKLNYTGVFLFEVLANDRALGTLHDRLTIVITALEQRYPELLEQYEFSNGLFPDDRFTQYYLQEKRIKRTSGSSAR